MSDNLRRELSSLEAIVASDRPSSHSRIDAFLEPASYMLGVNSAVAILTSEVLSKSDYLASDSDLKLAAAMGVGIGFAWMNQYVFMPFASKLRKDALERENVTSSPEPSRLKSYLRSAVLAGTMVLSALGINGILSGHQDDPGESGKAPVAIVTPDKGDSDTDDSVRPIIDLQAQTLAEALRKKNDSHKSKSDNEFVPRQPRPGDYMPGDFVKISEDNMKYCGLTDGSDAYTSAFLDMISFAEGAGYDVGFANHKITDLSTHPKTVWTNRKGTKSSVAGLCQMLPSNYDRLVREGVMHGFYKADQDAGCERLFTENGLTSEKIKKAIFTGNLSGTAYSMSGIWPSMPENEQGDNAACPDGTDAGTDACPRPEPHKVNVLLKMLRAAYHCQLKKNPSPCGNSVIGVGDSLIVKDSFIRYLEPLCGVGIKNFDSDRSTSQSIADVREGHGCDYFACEGKNTRQMDDSFDRVLDSGQYDSVIIMGGINDIFGGESVETVKRNLSNMYIAARAKGLRVIAVTPTPAADIEGWDDDKQKVLDDVVEWMMHSCSADIVVPAYAAMVDPENPGHLRKEYAAKKGSLHYSQAGKAALARVAYNSIRVESAAPYDENPDTAPVASPLLAENEHQPQLSR